MADSVREQLGAGANFRVRVTIIGALLSIVPLIGIALLLPNSSRDVLFRIYWIMLAGCFVHLLWILIKNPVPSARPPLLTRDLAMGWALLLPSLFTSFWPGIVGAPLFTVLVGATSVAERIRNRSAAS
ncbi:conserved membrane protein of unknown function [Streptomyces ambofaciens ATCC 23877]|uniref:Uncharacterized protein n=1 Tax=Streptomyces ambofaciens (strain ATCC 23877 / 3486 / DSM 40053 / JCM 4204 / NBRC 12836 / NRRL B-2516) TaxID=278992 RepID=A0A0K2AWI8_STRA7|nr:hypothetical protein [Streptomyces ambofaciens]AKZ57384.1 conserved membrane protein of unknown function [Streptomyces ambofaciens ATCC 23877]